MKLILVLLSTLFFGTTLHAQDVAAVNARKEIVLEIPSADLHKSLPDLKNTIKKIDGISFEGFCNSRKILLLKTTDDGLFQLLMVLKENHTDYFIKKQTSLSAAKEACGDNREIDASFSID
jgi:hypothetical protein